MKVLYTGLAILMSLSISQQAIGQNLDEYRWEKRLVLLVIDDEDQSDLDQQLAVFRADQEGMNERKLQVIIAKPKAFSLGLEKHAWKQSGFLYKRYRQQGEFEFILIGLDGGIKQRRQKVIPLKELYRIIDSMPMRAAEMRRKNN